MCNIIIFFIYFLRIYVVERSEKINYRLNPASTAQRASIDLKSSVIANEKSREGRIMMSEGISLERYRAT